MRHTLIAVLLLALAAVGCSGAEDTADLPEDADAAVEAAASAAEDAGVEVGTLDPAQCEELTTALESVPAAVASSLTGEVDVESVQQSVEAMREAQADVPEAIAEDFGVVVEAYDEVATTLAGLDLTVGEVPGAEAQQALSDLSTTLSAEELSAATANISSFVAGGCE